MKCHVCGADLDRIITDLPFKITNKSIIIVKDLPVMQCRKCGEYLIEDSVMVRVDEILMGSDAKAELEIISFAA